MQKLMIKNGLIYDKSVTQVEALATMKIDPDIPLSSSSPMLHGDEHLSETRPAL